jgi:hypothetical protein
MTRLNRDPSFDLANRILTGEKPPSSGDPTIQQYDAELDRNDPMAPETAGHGANFIPQISSGEVDQANRAQALGLDSGDTGIDQTVLTISSLMNGNDPMPGQGGLSGVYGNGSEKGKR